jgi:hypothetical protein
VIPPAKKAEIAAALVPFADAGYTVTVMVPDEGIDMLGWRVSLDKAGRHVSFRIATRANVREWAAVVALALGGSG